jgi:hypothetical protein
MTKSDGLEYAYTVEMKHLFDSLDLTSHSVVFLQKLTFEDGCLLGCSAV